MPRTFLISAGGTGGGIYPALAVIEALRRSAPEIALHYVGSVGGMEVRLVPRDLVTAYHQVPSGPVHGVGVRRTVTSLVKIAAGTLAAWRLVKQLRPELLFMTGGWATLPVAFACWLRRVPILIFLPDIEPALTIKFTSRLAREVLTATADSARYFSPQTKVIENGYPLRTDLMTAKRADGSAYFKLDPLLRTLLITGGSRGAHSLNNALAAILPDLLADHWQVIHISGELDWSAVNARRMTLSATEQAHYQAFPYLHDEMGLALAAADLVVSRAGASILGEFPYFGLPSILVPYPFAWRYQKVNADWLTSRGAAIRLDDAALSTDLLPAIRTLSGDPDKLAAMRSAAIALARPDASATIAHHLITFEDRARRMS